MQYPGKLSGRKPSGFPVRSPRLCRTHLKIPIPSSAGAVSYTHLDVYKRQGLDGIHLCISGEGGLLRASVEEGVLTYWPKAPDGPYAPEGEARSEHLAEPPGLRFARQAAAFLDLVEGRPVEYCTLEQAVHLERLLTRLDQSAQ